VRTCTLSRDLERRFDGDIPDELRDMARAGGRVPLFAAAAEANSRCCDHLALSAARVTALCRHPGSQISHWRQEGLRWRDQGILYRDIDSR
jgi:hypothetical protein